MKTTLKILLFFPLLLAAQEPRADIARINKSYESTRKLSMDITFMVFSHHGSTAPIDQQHGFYKKENSSYYNSLMGLETVVSGSKMLLIDQTRKSMELLPASAHPMPVTGNMDLEKLLEGYSDIRLVQTGKGERGYTVHLKKGQGQLEKFEFYFNTDNYLLTRMVLYYAYPVDLGADSKTVAGKPKLEITFLNVNTHPSFRKDEFDLGRYIVFGKKNKPVAGYKDYQFVESKI